MINTKNWKEFRVGDLFKANLGVLIPNDLLKPNGVFPVITGITENNGINGYIDENFNDFKYSHTLTISNRGVYSGTVYYHKYDFILGTNVIALESINFDLSDNIALYLATVLNKLPYGGYEKYPTKNGIVEDFICLPAKDNKPDFDYMENYIEEIKNKYVDELEKSYMKKIKLLKSII